VQQGFSKKQPSAAVSSAMEDIWLYRRLKGNLTNKVKPNLDLKRNVKESKGNSALTSSVNPKKLLAQSMLWKDEPEILNVLVRNAIAKPRRDLNLTSINTGHRSTFPSAQKKGSNERNEKETNTISFMPSVLSSLYEKHLTPKRVIQPDSTNEDLQLDQSLCNVTENSKLEVPLKNADSLNLLVARESKADLVENGC
jgi:hypothetical protein